MSSESLFPEVLWAQRSSTTDADKNYIQLTINVPDLDQEGLKVDLKDSSILFDGKCTTQGKKSYRFELNLHGEIDPSASSTHYTENCVRLKLQKKEMKEEYWPRLQKESQKLHWLRTDFDKWVDEDEQTGAPDDDFSNFSGMGGMPGMDGMGGMGGMGGGPDLSGMDFSQLGGGGGMGPEDDMGDDDDESDDDMPGLSGDKEDEPTASLDKPPTTTAKIEEVDDEPKEAPVKA